MKYKTIIGNIFVVIAVTALIGGLLLGFFGNQNKGEEDSYSDINDGDVIDYTNKNPVNEEDNEINEEHADDDENDEHNPHGEDYDDLGETVYQEVDDSKLAIPYEEILGEEVTEETKELAENFIEVFYNLDGNDPKHFIEESKEFMTERLYEELLEEPERPTHTTFNREYISSEISESKNLTEEEANEQIPYFLTVKGETTDVEGENKQEVTDVYTIILIKDQDDQYKVNHVYKNIYFQ